MSDQRTKTDGNIQISIADFAALRMELMTKFETVFDKIDNINAQLQERHLDVSLHQAKLEDLDQDIVRTNRHLELVDGRVVILERRAGEESAVNRAILTAAAKSSIGKLIDSIISQAGALIVLAIGTLIVWGLARYFKGTP